MKKSYFWSLYPIKMKIIFLLLLISVVTPLTCLGQEFTQNWGAPIQKTAQEHFSDLLYHQGAVASILKNEGDKSKLRVDWMDSLGSFHTGFEYSFKGEEWTKVFSHGEHLIVATTVYQEGSRMNQLKLYQMNTSGKVIQSITALELPANGGYYANFEVCQSPNRSFIGIIGSEAYTDKSNENIHLTVVDDNFKVLRNKTINTLLPSDKRRVNIPVINDEGVMYILKKYKIKFENFYQLYAYGQNGIDYKTELKLRVKKIADFSYTLDSEGNLILGGFFSSIGKTNFEGVFIAQYAPSLQNKYIKEYSLNDGVINAFKTKKEIDAYGYGLDNFRVSDCFVHGETILLMADHHSAYSDPKEGFRDYRKGLIVLGFSQAGGFLFGTPILTEQQDANDRGYWSGRKRMVTAGGVHIWHNIIGAPAKKIKLVGEHKPYYPTQDVKILPNGTIQSNVMEWSNVFEGATFQANVLLEEGKKKYVIVENEKRNQYTIGKIEFKNDK
jgi:hypothetical protein